MALSGAARQRVRGSRQRRPLLPHLECLSVQPDGIRDDWDKVALSERPDAPGEAAIESVGLWLRYRVRWADAAGGRLQGRVRRFRQSQHPLPSMAPRAARAAG